MPHLIHAKCNVQFDIESQRWSCIQESSDTNTVDADDLLDSDNLNRSGDVAGAGDSGSTTGVKPSQRFGYVSVVHDNKLVLFGGFDGNRWLNDMYVFDFESKKWSMIEAKGDMPSPRSCPAWAKDECYVYMQGKFLRYIQLCYTGMSPLGAPLTYVPNYLPYACTQ